MEDSGADGRSHGRARGRMRGNMLFRRPAGLTAVLPPGGGIRTLTGGNLIAPAGCGTEKGSAKVTAAAR